jgi:putative transposase
MGRPGYGRPMARQNRIQFHGANYHVGNRGVAKATVFHSDEDRHQFIAMLAGVIDEHGWICSSYCLMRNHYHLTLTTPEPNLGAGMGRLSQLYAQWFNHRHDRVGHLFQQRYWSQVIHTDEELSAAVLYILDNPVRAGVCSRPEQWRWSSARATAGLVPLPKFLDLSQLTLD